MSVAVVMPVTAGREDNAALALEAIARQACPPKLVVVVEDGPMGDYLPDEMTRSGRRVDVVVVPRSKHEPGREQPRNIGARIAAEYRALISHVYFVDSDVVLEPAAMSAMEDAIEVVGPDCVIVGPYEWCPQGQRPRRGVHDEVFFAMARQLRNDPRWAMFAQAGPERIYRNDLSAGLACFSGNLVWPLGAFMRVGGFWNEIHHGRCEDGELGLRAVAMDVPISFAAAARGYHLWHPVNTALAIGRNARDVPMLNARHPWVEQGAVFMVDRDGKAFDVRCSCGSTVPTIGWWEHAATCGAGLELAVQHGLGEESTRG